jgi:hypothetical protein
VVVSYPAKGLALFDPLGLTTLELSSYPLLSDLVSPFVDHYDIEEEEVQSIISYGT